MINEFFKKKICKYMKLIINIIRPKTSDESQFHQPPQEPSCAAHHEPKYKVIVRVRLIQIRKFKIYL
jgi:hypothetical protein